MNFEEFEKRMLPPIDGFNSSAPILTVEDVILAANRLKDEHGISCPTETMRLLNEVEHERVLQLCDKLEAI